MQQINGYEEVELDSSRANTFQSNFGCGDLDPVIVKLRFSNSDVIEFPIEGQQCFEKTIKDIKTEQFSHEERQKLTLVCNGTKLEDSDKLFELLTPC